MWYTSPYNKGDSMIVINLYGGPSSGKSTTAAGLFHKMKIEGHSVELVTEYAKDLVYSNQLESMCSIPEYIFSKQHLRLHRLKDHVDYAICDSPLLLSGIYAEYNLGPEWPSLNPFREFVRSVYTEYTNVSYFIVRPETFEVGGRMHDESQSNELDSIISEELRLVGEKYKKFTACHNIVDDLYSDILNTH